MNISARFYLKEPASIKPTLIYLIVKFGFFELQNGKKKYKHFKYSTGEKVKPADWDQKSGRVKGGIRGGKILNRLLAKYETTAVGICRKAVIAGNTLSFKLLEKEMNQTFRQNSNEKSLSLLAFWQGLKQNQPAN